MLSLFYDNWFSLYITSSSHRLPAIPKLLLFAVFTAASRFNPNEMPLPRDGEMWEAGCDYLASTRRILSRSSV